MIARSGGGAGSGTLVAITATHDPSSSPAPDERVAESAELVGADVGRFST